MTHEAILKQAIEKAVKNGWKDYLFHGNVVEILLYQDAKKESFADTNIRIKNGDAATNFNAVEQIIFSHDFARAFWGKGIHYSCNDCNKVCGKRPSGTSDCCRSIVTEKTNWQYHLQQMVLEEDPLLYIEKFL